MRIVFMGTPVFASRALERLLDDGYDICGVFTQPDKPKNRGMKLMPTPVKEVALKRGIPVFQPAKMKDGTALALLRELSPDLIADVAYGRILPIDILDEPPLGCVNIHPSLLPKYRGPAPIQWTVLNGDTETGVCSMYMAEGMDDGDIICQRRVSVGDGETFGQLYDRLSYISAELLSETLKAIEAGNAPRISQDHEKATLAPMITKEMSPINWTFPAETVKNRILGLDPWPAASSVLGDVLYKFFIAMVSDEKTSKAPGTILNAGKNGLEVACGDKRSVIIQEIQAPGGKRMPVYDYIRGHTLEDAFVSGDGE